MENGKGRRTRKCHIRYNKIKLQPSISMRGTDVDYRQSIKVFFSKAHCV